MGTGTRLLVTTALIAAPASAFAADHIMKVGEVLLSNNGSTTSQFVELEDSVQEPFPSPPYSIELFDAAGQSQGSQTITVPANTQRLLIATAQAQTDFGVTADAILTLTLPTNGQLCFKRGASALIHCLRWGTITTPVPAQSGTNPGASPGDGMSLQRSGNAYCVNTPTPDAANACPAVDAGPQPPVDAATPDAPMIDAPGGNPSNPPPEEDDGCSVGGGASWFGLAFLALLVLLRRSARR